MARSASCGRAASRDPADLYVQALARGRARERPSVLGIGLVAFLRSCVTPSGTVPVGDCPYNPRSVLAVDVPMVRNAFRDSPRRGLSLQPVRSELAVDVPMVRNAFRDSPLGDCPYNRSVVSSRECADRP